MIETLLDDYEYNHPEAVLAIKLNIIKAVTCVVTALMKRYPMLKKIKSLWWFYTNSKVELVAKRFYFFIG